MKLKNLSKNNLISIVIIVILLVALPIALYLSQQRQEIRKKAATPSGTVSMFLSATSATIPPGQNLPVNITFSATSTPENRGITSIKTILTYTFSGANPLTITDSDITGNLPSPWVTTKIVTTAGNTVTINIQSVYGQPGVDGYKPSGVESFATLNFHAQNTGPITLDFDPNRSVIRPKTDATLDILKSPLPQGTYTVASQPTITLTPTPTYGITSTPTPTDSTTVTPTPTRTPSVTPTPTVFPTNTPAATPQPTATVAPGTADYTLTGPAGTVNTQTNFTVAVNINTENTAVKEAQTTLSYEPTKVWWVSTTKGTFFPTLANINSNITAGWTLGKLVKGAGTGPSGSGSLLTFTFKAVCASSSTITIKANTGNLNNYVYKDITSNVNIYNGGTDSITITATGTGNCGLPPVSTPTPTRAPTPTPTTILTPTPTPGPGIINLFTGINRVKIFQFIIQFFNQFFNRSNCPTLSYKNNIWKPYVADYQNITAALTEITSFTGFSFINCKHPVTDLTSGSQ